MAPRGRADGPRRVGGALAPALAILALAVSMLLLLAGCGGGSRSASPGQSGSPTPATGGFSAQAARACAAVAPRLRASAKQLEAIDAQPGSPESKLPRLAALLAQVGVEVRALRGGLARLTAPGSRRRLFAGFLADLAALERVAGAGAGALRSGTLSGLRRFRPLARQFGARAQSLSRDAARIPALNACRPAGR